MMGLEELQSVQENLIQKLKQTSTLIESKRATSARSTDSDMKYDSTLKQSSQQRFKLSNAKVPQAQSIHLKNHA